MTALGPHQSIDTASNRDKFTLGIYDQLWDEYRTRVSYVGDYEQMIADHGATFVNDHIAFRTIVGQNPSTGITSLSRIFEALGYQPAGVYPFPDKHLNAIHYQHAHPLFPKLFISELRSWEFGVDTCRILEKYLSQHGSTVNLTTLQQLAELDSNSAEDDSLGNKVLDSIRQLPWPLPTAEDVEAINRVSQYAAWVLVHGYNVNHFTALVNSHGVDELSSIDKTVAALRKANVPMKEEIEGTVGSKLRQTATQAVVIDVPLANDQTTKWTYAYFELAERGNIGSERFEGFLGAQATQLFDMTKK